MNEMIFKHIFLMIVLPVFWGIRWICFTTCSPVPLCAFITTTTSISSCSMPALIILAAFAQFLIANQSTSLITHLDSPSPSAALFIAVPSPCAWRSTVFCVPTPFWRWEWIWFCYPTRHWLSSLPLLPCWCNKMGSCWIFSTKISWFPEGYNSSNYLECKS